MLKAKDRPYTTGPGAADLYGTLAQEAAEDEYWLAVEYRKRQLIAEGDDSDMSEICGVPYENDDELASRWHAEVRRLLNANDNATLLEAATGLQEVLTDCCEAVARDRMEREAKDAQDMGYPT